MNSILKENPCRQLDETTSRRITSLRFILVCMVVLIHDHLRDFEIAAWNLPPQPRYVEAVKVLLSEIMCSVAVPMFYIFSGYLFFYKNNTYKTMLKKKTISLLVPYILWNVLNIILYWVFENCPLTSGFFTNKNNLNCIENWKAIDWIDAVVGKITKMRGDWPIDGPLWYVRDLFLLMIISPLLKKIVDLFPVTTLITLTILWVFKPAFYIVSPQAFLFFSLGYYFVKHSESLNMLDKVHWKDILPLYLITAAFSVYTTVYQNKKIPLLNELAVLEGIAVFYKLSLMLIHTKKIYSCLEYLSQYVFWIFAVHTPLLLHAIRKINVHVLPMHGVYYLIEYFITGIVCVLCSLGTGIVVKKLLPKLYAVFTGKR